jgi:hypothetical protein
MGAVDVVLQVVAICRQFGVPVTFEPGWEMRGNGTTAAYVGGIEHHTVTPFSDRRPDILVHGRSDLDGPLCNFAGLASGGLHVIAAHPANHAGASGGRSMGPLPVTRLFNPRVLGLEIVYPGTVPMTDAQYRTAQVWAYAVAMVVGGGNIEHVRAHFETSVEGKIDPAWAANPTRSYDMNALRVGALAIRTQEDDMPFGGVEADFLLNREVTIPSPANPKYEETHLVKEWLGRSYYWGSDTYHRVARLEAKVDALTGALSDDEATILAAVRDAQDPEAPTDYERLGQSIAKNLPAPSGGITPEQLERELTDLFGRIYRLNDTTEEQA